MIEMLPGKNGV